ncbi:DUF692 domain-containing protein [Amycolatopsis antarctica]|nr:DUF692 family multinuclear iron-containing protein [Amycolatopsis antarctica]
MPAPTGSLSSTATSGPSWPEPAGVGMSFLPSRPDLVTELLPSADYVEMGPELFARATGDERIAFDTEAAEAALRLAGDLPVVLHGLELSIGSAHGWNEVALHCLDRFLELREVLWHSEHLNFLNTTAADGSVIELGLPMPLPFTAECAELVATRADLVMDRYGMMFLLENPANYLPDLPRDPGWDEPAFLTAITERSRGGLLLDLYNLWTNCVNHRLDPQELLARMPLDRVVEIHVAGGEERDGLLLDSHSAAVPDPVWRMLETVVPKASRLAGVTVEVLDVYAGKLGADAIGEQLATARSIWDAR